MEKDKRELRILPMTEFRVDASNEVSEVVGHAAVFDSWSETLGGLFPFKEKVRKGAFVESLINDDIRALFNHDPNYVLGRNKVGTLELTEDEVGLRVKIIPPETSWAKDLVTSIKRGDISQMSIGFIVLEDKWSTENGIDTRELVKVRLFDVSTVTFPAYSQTDVGVRAMELYHGYKDTQNQKEEESKKSLEKAKEKNKLNHLKIKFKNL
ncbi:MAG: HK97 family phage prohead protease [Candidatus Moranbacteria bacterium]|nr:HK97 family phage prohead protease [Candidatus Moranbacteria bacterium]